MHRLCRKTRSRVAHEGCSHVRIMSVVPKCARPCGFPSDSMHNCFSAANTQEAHWHLALGTMRAMGLLTGLLTDL